MVTQLTPALAIGLIALLTITVATRLALRINLAIPTIMATMRGAGQLAIAALIITAAATQWWSTCLVLLAMLLTATITTARSIGATKKSTAPILGCLGLAGIPPLAILGAVGALPATGIAVIPICGILFGNTMAAHTIFGRRAFSALAEHHDTLEQYLALGIRPATATRQIIHPHIPEGFITGLDAVRTTGIVTLPGAFIGVMLGGGTASQAATAQIVVIFGILCSQSLAVAAQYWCICRGHITAHPKRDKRNKTPNAPETKATTNPQKAH